MPQTWDELAQAHGKPGRVIAPPEPSSNASSSALALLEVALKARRDHARHGDDPWIASPWRWLRDLKPVPKSLEGRKILREWLVAIGIDAADVKGTVPMLALPGWPRAVVKLSTQWEDGSYHFQQIRDFDYDGLLCLGISPKVAHLWVVPRAVALAASVPQHSTDSRTISFNADTPPDALAPYGGTIGDATRFLLGLDGREAA